MPLHIAGVPPKELRISRPLQVLGAGSHHPVLCAMESDAGPEGAWVVKQPVVLSAASTLGAFGTVAELAGAEVCAWVGIPPPAIALTRFPTEMDPSVLRSTVSGLEPADVDELVQVWRANAGKLAFCVRHLPNAADLLPELLSRKRTRASMATQAAALIVADGYMAHTDRQAANPNALLVSDQIVPIDHNLAFPCLARPKAVAADEAKRTILAQPPFLAHVARHAARLATDADWETAVQRIEAVSEGAISAVVQSWPAELDGEPMLSVRGIHASFERFMVDRRLHLRVLAQNVRATIMKPE